MIKFNKYAFLSLLVLFGANNVKAQTEGVWKGAKKSSIWEYGFMGTKEKFSTVTKRQESTSDKNNDGYLPKPQSGAVKVVNASSGGGDFELNDNKLQITSSSSNFPVKFSAYDIPKATAVTSLFFDISLNENKATNGLIILGFGNSSTPVYKNTFQLTGAAQPGLFGAITLTIGENFATPRYRYYRAESDNYGYSALGPANLLVKAGTHKIEIYCNNSEQEQEYAKGSDVQKLPSRTYHVYVNGQLLKSAGSPNIPASNESKAGDIIDAFIMNGSNSTLPTENANTYTISNVRLGAGK